HPARHLARRDARLLEREDHLLRDVGGEELRLEVLEYHADHAGQLRDAAARDRFALEADVPVHIAGEEARGDVGEAARQRALPRAGGAHDDGEAPGGHGALDPGERGPAGVGIGAVETPDGDPGRHSRTRPRTAEPRKGSTPSPSSRWPVAVAGPAQAGTQRCAAISCPATKPPTVPATMSASAAARRPTDRRGRAPSRFW